MSTLRTVEVWADWADLGGARRLGVLHVEPVRGRELHSFEYDSAWLAGRTAQAFDPGLVLDPRLGQFAGRQFPPADTGNFGALLDSAPDRWGRVLMDRREALRACSEGRPVRALREIDYLLGVHDAQRLGGLRFKLPESQAFLADDPRMAAPPWTRLRELEQASLRFEDAQAPGNAATGDFAEAWLAQLLGPGSSLGGARPKAGVVDEQGALWIAKFPSRSDRREHGAWEFLVHQLARQAGLNISPARLEPFGDRGRTFLTRRFDRTGTGERLHYASAMTLLDHRDGESGAQGASYLELAELLIRQGAATRPDLEELWRRIVFSICVSNVDDHLRNHGFLLEAKGWRLAPAFDLNPEPDGDGLQLNINEVDNRLDLDLAMGSAKEFRIELPRAREIMLQVRSAVCEWRRVARSLHLPETEVEGMSPAFQRAGPAS
ncbi:MAG: HipA domain-containing protein [Candidatus Delongbacteria bacterium]